MRSIKKLRSIKGLSQFQLASKLGLSRVYVAYLESDNCVTINHNMVEKLCEFFGCSIFEIYGLDVLKEIPKSDDDYKYIIKLLYAEMGKAEQRNLVLELQDMYEQN